MGTGYSIKGKCASGKNNLEGGDWVLECGVVVRLPVFRIVPDAENCLCGLA